MFYKFRIRHAMACYLLLSITYLVVANVAAEECTHGATNCNAKCVPADGTCCCGYDEDARIIGCNNHSQSPYRSCVKNPTRRCGTEVEVVNGVCSNIGLGDCGGDVAEGGCNQGPCPGG